LPIIADGTKNKQIKFGVNRWGEKEAKEKAIRTRRSWEHKYKENQE